MGADDAVCAAAACGQGAALDVPCGDAEHGLGSAVVDGKLHADFFHSHIAHDPPAADVQKLGIAGNLLTVQKGFLYTADGGVVIFRSLETGGIVFFRQFIQGGVVVNDRPGLGVPVPGTRKGRVEKNPHAKEENQGNNKG